MSRSSDRMVPSLVSAEGIAALQAHPGFVDAVRRSAASSVRLHRSERLAGWILGDRARALFGHCAIYLDATRDPDDPRSGLTASRLKQLVAELGLCSPGRAGAMLGLMRVAGYIVPAPGAADRRVQRLVPGERLLQLMQARLSGQFAATAGLLPEAAPAHARIGEVGFGYALMRALGGYFTAGFRVLDHAPELALFTERSAGMVMLYDMLLCGESFPPRGPVPFTIAETASRLGVSRTHILRLLREAQQAGLLRRSGETLEFSPQVVEAILNLFAVLFLYLATAAREALGAGPPPDGAQKMDSVQARWASLSNGFLGRAGCGANTTAEAAERVKRWRRSM